MQFTKLNPQRDKNLSILVMTNNKVGFHDPIANPETNVSNFHGAMKNVLTLAQVFGLMPVYGIRNPSIDGLYFKWLSLRTFYSLIGVFSLFISTTLFLLQFLREDINFESFVSVIFNLCQTLGYYLFIKLAMKWRMLNKGWLKMEETLSGYSYQPNDSRRFTTTTAIIMTFALIEHVFSIIKTVHISLSCPIQKTEPVRAYFGLCCSNVFSATSYAPWKAILTEIPVILGTFQWSFLDVFIILCSAAMAERFKQINKQVDVTQIQNQEFWKKIREDYNCVWSFSRTLDSVINNMVTLSFASNLIFICWQMFNSLKPKRDTFIAVYFYYSFGFLLLRTGLVSTYCCWLNDESKEILNNLFNIPKEYFSLEADRLINQVCSSPASLTGSNFFAVTRGLCLQVASAIITFEIILIQMGPSFLKTDELKPLDCLP